jgi:hypothetical protein
MDISPGIVKKHLAIPNFPKQTFPVFCTYGDEIQSGPDIIVTKFRHSPAIRFTSRILL